MPKRTNYLTWTDYFTSIARLVAQRSKDPSTQVGAVIVNPDNNTLISTGYNGFPRGCSNDDFPWGNGKLEEKTFSKISADFTSNSVWLNSKYPYVVHAEANALIHARQNCTGFALYTTLFPCNECAKLIIQAGIKKIYYLDIIENEVWKEPFQATQRMFKSAGVVSERVNYQPKN
ncbi:MAG: dCMP deaminase family protein [Candidatus Moeniiplasma glomeromycotorum]|nr:dCMP deaminase family protein [Candidatus Moeniiplasma glomeromycotorum]MCE8162465.1 dCMP deaminase family protein [Candidatus Moeniiplasma glomeromycotorum]MCE8166391.1 dCMP deaminase family protein [Candidatus Moeniiplasma glomeromycotorum]MCE8166873.1 dCMP deaminase family protein [Candidatus Moeniiplasma glomeromycotorum]